MGAVNKLKPRNEAFGALATSWIILLILKRQRFLRLSSLTLASHHPGSLLSHKKALSLRPSARYIFLSLA